MLGLCAKAGLVKVGVVAVDGTKIAASATHHQNRSYRQIAEEILKEAGEIDAAEDELYGEKRGDELPEGFADRDRAPRTVARGEARARGRAGREGEEGAARPGQAVEGVPGAHGADLALERRVEAEHDAWRAAGVASNGRRAMNRARLPSRGPARGARRASSTWSTPTAAT